MRRLNGLTLLMVFLLFGATQAWAEFTLTKGISLRQEYNDNVDLEAEDEQDDFITTISPRLSLSWQTKYIDLNLNANVNFKYYFDSGDTETDAGDASTLTSVFDLYRGMFFLRISDTFSRVTIDEGRRSSEDNSRVNQTNTNRLTINPYLQFVPLSDLQVRLGYSYENLWYEEEEGDDAESHNYSLVLTKPLSARMSLSLSGSRLLYRPKNPSESRSVFGEDEGTYEYDRDTVRFGLDYQVSDNLQISGGYGHSWLVYDVREDTDSDVWDVSADYQLSSTLKAGIAYRFDYSVSVENGPGERDNLSVYIAYDDRMQVKLSMFVASEDYVEINRQTDSYGGALVGTVPLTDRYGLDWGLHYTNYDEVSSERRFVSITVPLPPNSIFPGDSITVLVPRLIDTSEKYDRYGARLALYYDISMGRLSAGYTYTLNDSDLDANDYTNNIFYLQASLTF